jgi:hypothetical protein
MGSNPANTYGVGDNFPTYFVNWYETLVYCNKRSIAEGLMPCYTIGSSTNPDDWGSIPTSLDPTWDAVICNFQEKGFRLPTEAEWEYAARYNDDRIYPWGNGEPFPGTCNFDHNEGGTTVVGYFLSGNSSLGLCDMAGNVYEWCWDWYDSYTADIQTDPTGVISGTQRVVRGGGWPSSAWYIRCAHHTGLVPYQSYSDGASGFRIARTK